MAKHPRGAARSSGTAVRDDATKPGATKPGATKRGAAKHATARAATARATTARATTAADQGDTRDRDTERRILDAAHAVFLRRGTAGARMTDIAQHAGVNHALLHYYFRSKERLAEAVFRRAASQIFPPLLAILASDAPLEAKVERIVALEIDSFTRTPYLPGYLLAELNHHPERAAQLLNYMAGIPVDQVRPRLVGALAGQITERVRAGAMRPIAPEQFILNLIALCAFPFAARPMVMAVLGLDDAGFAALMQRRRAELPAFFVGALRP